MKKHPFSLLIILYIIGVGLDTYTTYLASPDLKFEDNFIVSQLNLKWTALILMGSIITIVNISIFLYAKNYFKGISINNIKSSIILFGIFGFYYHLIYSYLITINNYLSYIYLYSKNSILYNISNTFISNRTYVFYIYLKIFIAILSLILLMKFRINNRTIQEKN